MADLSRRQHSKAEQSAVRAEQSRADSFFEEQTVVKLANKLRAFCTLRIMLFHKSQPIEIPPLSRILLS